jgi:hypothetical protein
VKSGNLERVERHMENSSFWFNTRVLCVSEFIALIDVCTFSQSYLKGLISDNNFFGDLIVNFGISEHGEPRDMKRGNLEIVERHMEKSYLSMSSSFKKLAHLFIALLLPPRRLQTESNISGRLKCN